MEVKKYKGTIKQKSLSDLRGFSLAVLTRLELATSCVTGRHSNQTELQHHLFCFQLLLFVVDYGCKDTTFFHICKHFFKKNSLFLKLFFILLIINKIFLIKLFYKKYSFFSYIMIFYAQFACFFYQFRR